jgi:hypothetical protein
MAFTPETFSPVGANSTEAQAIYAYQTADTLTDVGVAGYFSFKELQLKESDIIIVSASDGTGIYRIQADTSSASPDISSDTAGLLTSVFGRTGNVIAQNGDYNTDQVTEALNLYFTEARVQAVPEVAGAEQTSNKNAANGYAGLSSGKIDISQIPLSVQGAIKVVGFWDADTNTPDLSALTLAQGESYQVSVDGSTNLNGETNWKVRDLAVWDDTLSGNWFKLDNTDDVLSIFGRVGAVVAAAGDYTSSLITNSSGVVGAFVTDALNTLSSNFANFLDKSTYDPTAKNGDAFSMGNMDETATNKIFLDTERTKLAGIADGAQVNTVDDVNGQTGTVSVDQTIFSEYIIGTTADPSTTATTSGTAPTLAEMTHTFTPASATNKIRVDFKSPFLTNDKKNGIRCGVFIDGTLEAETESQEQCGDDADEANTMCTFWEGSLPVASTTISIGFWGTADTSIAVGVLRNMRVKETREP